MAVRTARLVDGDDGGRKLPNERSYRCVWQVHCSDPLDTAAQVLASPLFPQRGDKFTGWTEFNGVYSPKATPDDPAAVVVDQRARRSADSPFVWEVTISYEGIDSPTARPADVKYSQVPYQEQVIQDRHGRFVANSAGDLYDGGLTVDRQRGLLTITRHVPYDGWDPDKAETFRNSLNQSPYRHGTLLRAGQPVESPPGTAKIKTLDADRVVTRQHPNPALCVYHWAVTCQIEFDYSKFLDKEGRVRPRLWRRVLADVGYHEVTDGGMKKPIRFNHQPASTPQLLDGKGKRAGSYGPKPTVSFLGPVPPGGAVIAEPDEYQTFKNEPLVVPAPGVLANDSEGVAEAGSPRTVVVVSGPDHGTLTLAGGGVGGGFTYTPDVDHRGWDRFTYKVNNGVDGNETSVIILVADANVPVNVFEVYEPKDWSEIASWVGGW
jgi:hypothetical protein